MVDQVCYQFIRQFPGCRGPHSDVFGHIKGSILGKFEYWRKRVKDEKDDNKAEKMVGPFLYDVWEELEGTIFEASIDDHDDDNPREKEKDEGTKNKGKELDNKTLKRKRGNC